VDFIGNSSGLALAARSTVSLKADQSGCQVVLAFEAGDVMKPIILGCIEPQPAGAPGTPATVKVDGEQIVVSAERELVLRCGKASITLTRAGKVLIHGEYVLNASAGLNRIRGGSVQIN